MTASDTHLPRVDTRAATDHVAEVYHPDGTLLRGIARVLDLSVAGACLESTGEWNEGDRFSLRVLLESRHLLVVSGRFVWKRTFTRTFQYGVRFSLLTKDQRNVLRAFVDSYAVRLRRMGPKPFHPDALI